jgi:DNA-binding LacI/PurR family transcriptional regulator
MAAKATEILIQRLALPAGEMHAFEEVVFPTKLILRKSSGLPI